VVQVRVKLVQAVLTVVVRVWAQTWAIQKEQVQERV
jgi:hypothetical protein